MPIRILFTNLRNPQLRILKNARIPVHDVLFSSKKKELLPTGYYLFAREVNA